MNKRIFSFLIVVFIISFVNVSAKENNLSVSYEELNKTDVLNYEKDLLRQMKSLLEENKNKDVLNSINFENTVKVFKVEKLESIRDIENAVNNDSYYYRVPLLVDSGYIYSTLQINKNKVESYDTSMIFDKSLNQVAYLFETSIVDKIVEENKLDYTDIVVFTIPSIKTDFLFVKKGEKTLVIPFASRPDFLDVENGKVYEFEDFSELVNNLLKDISESDNNLKSKSGGGIGEFIYSYSHIVFIAIFTVLLSIFIKGIGRIKLY